MKEKSPKNFTQRKEIKNAERIRTTMRWNIIEQMKSMIRICIAGVTYLREYILIRIFIARDVVGTETDKLMIEHGIMLCSEDRLYEHNKQQGSVGISYLFDRNISRKFALPLSYSFCRTAIIILIVIRNNNNAIPLSQRRENENYNRMRSSKCVLGEWWYCDATVDAYLYALLCSLRIFIFIQFFVFSLWRFLSAKLSHTKTLECTVAGERKNGDAHSSEVVAAKTASASFICIENGRLPKRHTHV